jgi:hypothetical protein
MGLPVQNQGPHPVGPVMDLSPLTHEEFLDFFFICKLSIP